MMTWRVISTDGSVINGGTKKAAIDLALNHSTMYVVDGTEKTVYSIPQDKFTDLRIACSNATYFNRKADNV